MMNTAECTNDYIWYTISSDGRMNDLPTFSILPDDKSLKSAPTLDEVPAQNIPIAMDAIRVMCLSTYNCLAAFKIGYIEYT